MKAQHFLVKALKPREGAKKKSNPIKKMIQDMKWSNFPYCIWHKQ